MSVPQLSSERDTASRHRGRRIAVVVAVLIAAAIGAVVLFGALSSAPDPSSSQDAAGPSPAPAATAPDEPSSAPVKFVAPTPAPLGPSEEDEVERAEETAVSFVAAENEIGRRADGSAIGVDQIATGFVLGELESSARELFDLGYRRTGEARVTQTTASAIDLTAEPPSMTLTVCVDVSDIDVLDKAGNSLKASLYDPGRPVKHVYGAVFQDDVWKLATHAIPDDQDCPLP